VNRVVTRRAPAKVNLYLRVVGRRDDGYHELDSMVVFADLCDRVEVEESTDLTLQIDGPFAAALEGEADNLVLRAARALAEAAGRPAQAAIRLTKSIPVAAGLGGGSADAAAALTALEELWDLDRFSGRLPDIAAALGSDVPICLRGQPATVLGVGDLVAQLQAPPRVGLLLANPGEPLGTADVFRAYAERRFHANAGFSALLAPLSRFADAHALAEALRLRGNDLTGAAMSLRPSIRSLLLALEALPGCRLAQMTGSGATCFALFDDVEAAVEAAEALPDGVWRHAGSLLDAA
jgi:4-diphosphocytidyl-2-C-methyl-D-erythritol kinase